MLCKPDIAHVIVIQARSWIGTSFAHQGRVKAGNGHRGGCDCLGLIIGVASELGITSRHNPQLLIKDLDCQIYGKNPTNTALFNILKMHLKEIEKPSIQPGDIGLFDYIRGNQHLAIVSEYADGNLGLIHAYAKARKVVEHRFDEEWRMRLVGAFRFK